MYYKLIKLCLIILLIYISPVFLILTGLISFEYRFYVLEVATILVVLYSLLTNVRLNKLGFTRKNLRVSIKHILPITLIFALPIVLTLIVGWVRIDNSKIPWGFYLFFVFISSPSQEILYRGYLFHLLSKKIPKKIQITHVIGLLFVPNVISTKFEFIDDIKQIITIAANKKILSVSSFICVKVDNIPNTEKKIKTKSAKGINCSILPVTTFLLPKSICLM